MMMVGIQTMPCIEYSHAIWWAQYFGFPPWQGKFEDHLGRHSYSEQVVSKPLSRHGNGPIGQPPGGLDWRTNRSTNNQIWSCVAS